MRKMIVVLTLAAAALMAAMAPRAEAQTYPNVAGRRAFSPEANFMSLPGFLRFSYYRDSGQWISREQAIQIARDQGADVGPAPTGGAGG